VSPPAVLLTGAGKRYDIVSCFARLTKTVVADPSPLAPARYAAHVRVSVPLIEDPAYVPALERLCEEHGVGAVLPLTDLDIEVLARAREEGRLPALVPSSGVARCTYDKYAAHLLLTRHALPSPHTVLPDDDLDGRCLNAIPRTMLESRGGESIKGQVIRDEELIELGRRTMDALRVTGPATIQVFRDPEVGLAITDVNTRFGGAFPAPVFAALPGRTYPELIVRMAAGEPVQAHVGEFQAGMTFTRYYWQLELDERLAPTGRDIVPGGPGAPRAD